jgi:multiple sugar transport system substrate-binding protein
VIAQEARTLTIVSHNVHKTAATGGDSTYGREHRGRVGCQKNKVTLNWVTLDIGPLHDRLLRELSLGETSVDLAAVLNTRVVPSVASSARAAGRRTSPTNPIEDLDGISPGLLKATVVDGKRVAVPYRHATNALLYNKTLLEERGVAAPDDARGTARRGARRDLRASMMARASMVS